jgi:hypothetical protein
MHGHHLARQALLVLSYRLTLTNTPSMQHERRVGSGATCTLIGSYLSSGVGSKAILAKLLLGYRCEDTCHAAIPDPRTGPAPETL